MPAIRPFVDIKNQDGSKRKKGERGYAKRLHHRTVQGHIKRLTTLSDSELSNEELSAQMSIVGSLLDTNLVYPFRLANAGTASSTAGGVLSGFASFDPSNVPFAEFATLQALFNQVRLVEARFTVVNANPHADGYATGFQKFAAFVSCDPGLTATTPGSIANIIDCPNSHMWNLASPRTFTFVYKAKDTEFARTTVPAPGPYAGCYGQFQWYQGGLTVSTAYFSYILELFLEFTSRT